MDHAQLTTADYAHISANEAAEQARKLSLKLDGLADILGISQDEIIARGKLVKEERERKKEEEEKERDMKREAEFKASGLSREDWNSKKIMEMNLRSCCDAYDLKESEQITFNMVTGLLGITR